MSVNQNSSQQGRRQFLGAAGATLGLPLFLPRHVLGNMGRPTMGMVPPSEQIHLGVIGIGPRATYDLQAMLTLPEVRCVAVADVQAQRRDAARNMLNNQPGQGRCEFLRDFRTLLDRQEIDAVLIGTGDRWHARAAIMSAEAGKDVYCEKPCGITMQLCEEIVQVFERTGRVFQAGTQRRSVPNFQQAVRLAQEGKLGQLETLYASIYVPTLQNHWLPGQPTPEPTEVDWNLWLGPAPWRPYNEQYVQGGWRGYYDFDSGARLLDWGAHTGDLCQWANQSDATLPKTYEAKEDGIVCTYENGVKLIFDFIADPFGDRGPKWISRLGTCPIRLVGSAGSLETGDSGETVASTEALQSLLSPAAARVKGLDVTQHAQDFFSAVKTRQLTAANATVMRNSHLTCHAAALAWILQRKLELNPTTFRFVNDDEANTLRQRAERKWA
ncbi:MAG: Gfo/Idh/MocA family oxidoreductase [Planctomycetaceae bacterium]|nr:Gfo/Idh/MocA family oxidoreductase [Planctomycetaceae bacterium]